MSLFNAEDEEKITTESRDSIIEMALVLVTAFRICVTSCFKYRRMSLNIRQSGKSRTTKETPSWPRRSQRIKTAADEQNSISTRRCSSSPLGAPRRWMRASRTVRGIIERHGGKILVIKKWDERKLAYEIKKQKRGLYVIAYFTAPGNAVAPIERDVNSREEVLRVLITDADHLNQNEMEAVEPQPIQPREERSWDRPPMGMGEDCGGYDRGGDRGDRGGDRGDDRSAATDPAASERNRSCPLARYAGRGLG